ncbi:MAG: hypothetical protein H0T78_01940, partial [Longispora sp.]|nr:hypothetical protein [Longispora sp. (in: high G+C Gram-positive bacteria)]
MAFRMIKAMTIGAAAIVAFTACGNSGNNSDENSGQNAPSPSSSSSHDGMSMGTTTTAAADLRGGLTYLLTEHVYRAGIALKTAVDKSGNMEDPTVKAAVANLDENSVALSKAVGSAYPAAEAPFLESWRQHIGFFVDYTLGKATNDTA